jgi:hypothetical protein
MQMGSGRYFTGGHISMNCLLCFETHTYTHPKLSDIFKPKSKKCIVRFIKGKEDIPNMRLISLVHFGFRTNGMSHIYTKHFHFFNIYYSTGTSIIQIIIFVLCLSTLSIHDIIT